MTDEVTLSIGAGELRVDFWPAAGLLGVSLQMRGEELLRRIDDLEVARRKGSTAGIPLLYPWANRLSGLHYRAAGREVTLDRGSALLHFDEQGLPMHGVPWGHLCWKVVESEQETFRARLDWDRLDLLELFPFPHRVEITGKITPDSLTIRTRILANEDSAVPISFGFHPYFGIPDVPRTRWRLQLPALRKLELDAHGIPTGKEESAAAFDEELGERSFDDSFALVGDAACFSLSGGEYSIRVEFLEGFTHAQVFAPNGREFVALEPMTAPASALVSGKGLRVVERGGEFRGTFRIGVEAGV